MVSLSECQSLLNLDNSDQKIKVAKIVEKLEKNEIGARKSEKSL